MARLTLTVNIPEVRKVMLDAVCDVLNNAIQKSVGGIKTRIGLAAGAAIQGCEEYKLLIDGELRHQLGVVDAAPILQSVIRNIAEGIIITIRRVSNTGSNIVGGMTIEMLKGDYSEVLGVDGASFTSEGGYQIDWLEWLTLEGDRIIVADYKYVGGFPEISRTGYGLMKKPGSWALPAQFSGTASDNWITRALAGIGVAVEDILAEELQRNL